jgi:putative oxidoreductase
MTATTAFDTPAVDSPATAAPAVDAPPVDTPTRRFDLDALTRDLGLLALRLAVGLVLAGHGAQKLFGWWGGPGFDLMVTSLGQSGYNPAGFFAYLLGYSELLGGLFLALGLFTPLAGAAVIGVMFNAVVDVHWQSGVWAQNGGYELALLFGVAALAVGFTGPGRLSGDRNRLWVNGHVLAGLVSLGLGLTGALIVMAIKAG